MTINPTTLKLMKEDVLPVISVQRLMYDGRGYTLDHKDYIFLSNYIANSKNLRELDFSSAHGSLESLAEGLKKNTSITSLNLSQVVQEHELPKAIEILRECPNVTQLNLDYCGLQNIALTRLSIYLRNTPSLTAISLVNSGVNHETGEIKLDRVTSVLKNSVNILSFNPPLSPELTAVCEANKEAAHTLLAKAATPRAMTADEVIETVKRLPAMLHLLENESNAGRAQIAEMLIGVEDTAQRHGIEFPFPARYLEIAMTLPRPFYPSQDKVDFTVMTSSGDLDKVAIYKAVEAGQVDELNTFLRTHNRKLTSEECLLKPEGKLESMIELAAHQSKLADIMDTRNWGTDPRGFKQVAEGVSQREWQRQMKEPIANFVSELNAVSFKTEHRHAPLKKAFPKQG